MCTAQRRLDGKVPGLRAAIWHCVISEAAQLGRCYFHSRAEIESGQLLRSPITYLIVSHAQNLIIRGETQSCLPILIPPLE